MSIKIETQRFIKYSLKVDIETILGYNSKLSKIQINKEQTNFFVTRNNIKLTPPPSAQLTVVRTGLNV